LKKAVDKLADRSSIKMTGSYAKKALLDYDKHHAAAERNSDGQSGPKNKAYYIHTNKSGSRRLGLQMAISKLSKEETIEETQLDELHGKGQLEKIRSGRYKKLLATRDEVPTHKNPHGTAIRRADNLRNMRDSQKVTRELGHKKDINYPSYRDIAKVDRASQKRKEKESGIKEETLDEISQRLVGRYRSLAGIDLTNRTNKALRDDQANRPVDKENRKKRINRVAGIKRADAHFKEETQIDELSYETVARYHRKAADRYQTGEEPYEKRKKGRELATRKRAGGMMGIPKAKVMAKEETLDEKAPPGAKFERMVKHIKKGYSKDGLTAKEKSIAYATAWKAKKREEGE
jgi:hypothetical protein